jgi:hypothetical protein
MTWTYESSGDGSDTRKLASMINDHNLYYQHCRDSTLGITARETAFNTQFGETLGTTNNAFLSTLQGTVNSFRETMPSLQSDMYSIFQSYMQVRGREDFDSSSLQTAIEGLINDMHSNTKSVEPSVISVTNNSNTHIFHSEIHARCSELSVLNSGNPLDVQKVSDLASETLTFEVTQEQSQSGRTAFKVYGDAASTTSDVAGGFGQMSAFTTSGWNSFGVLTNGSAVNAASDSDEVAAGWRCFDAISSGRFTTAPETALVTRNTAAGEPYYGATDFKWIGDDTNATLYLAQRIANPLRNLNTTAWGANVNTNASIASGLRGAAGKVIVCSFYYKGVPTGYTLTPEILSGGNTRTADEVVQAVTSDGSSTWRLAVSAFFVRPGDTDTDMVFALKLTNGGGNTSSGIDVQLSRISLEVMSSSNLRGNLWFIGVPSITPVGLGGKDTFTLEQTSEGKWQKFFTKFSGSSTRQNRPFALKDPNGQAYQLPSNTTETELESLITIEDK